MDDIEKFLAIATIMRTPGILKQLRLWHFGVLDRKRNNKEDK
ncbi:hypothetical protein SAR03_22990 [Staphylococcus arlettae]|uniref:Uncharacterized protein n=1 Tax=Staphylococcus arlettae TaxID=29378 RepID=A0ABQ0XZN3_9STAP|nr:hypothetical protein N039_11970 [Staphylococcus sp. EGD-HP3]GEQ01262.1 hypothetical protein SAR03_22990 [Staphylococcus arlettae]